MSYHFDSLNDDLFKKHIFRIILIMVYVELQMCKKVYPITLIWLRWTLDYLAANGSQPDTNSIRLIVINIDNIYTDYKKYQRDLD